MNIWGHNGTPAALVKGTLSAIREIAVACKRGSFAYHRRFSQVLEHCINLSVHILGGCPLRSPVNDRIFALQAVHTS